MLYQDPYNNIQMQNNDIFSTNKLKFMLNYFKRIV